MDVSHNSNTPNQLLPRRKEFRKQTYWLLTANGQPPITISGGFIKAKEIHTLIVIFKWSRPDISLLTSGLNYSLNLHLGLFPAHRTICLQYPDSLKATLSSSSRRFFKAFLFTRLETEYHSWCIINLQTPPSAWLLLWPMPKYCSYLYCFSFFLLNEIKQLA